MEFIEVIGIKSEYRLSGGLCNHVYDPTGFVFEVDSGALITKILNPFIRTCRIDMLESYTFQEIKNPLFLAGIFQTVDIGAGGEADQ